MVSCMTIPLRVHMLRINSVVILVLTINSLKMKQMIDFFCFAVVERLRAELISKYYLRPFCRFRIHLRIRKKNLRNYSRILNYSEMNIPTYFSIL